MREEEHGPGTNPPPRKPTTRRKADDGGTASTATAPSARPARRASGPTDPDTLRKELRGFVAARPQGWNHDDWLRFLEDLHQRGHNINDREAIGLALERERLDFILDSIRGMGPRRRRALIERYGTTWNARNAPVDEIAQVAAIPRALAEEVKERLT